MYKRQIGNGEDTGNAEVTGNDKGTDNPVAATTAVLLDGAVVTTAGVVVVGSDVMVIVAVVVEVVVALSDTGHTVSGGGSGGVARVGSVCALEWADAAAVASVGMRGESDAVC